MRRIMAWVATAVGAASWVLVGTDGPRGDHAGEVATLAWLAGTWTGVRGTVETEEVWLPPKGGAMLGLHRDVAGDRMVAFEFLRIGTRQGKLAYFASPGGAKTTVFPIKEAGEKRVVFEDPENDYPQRILYWIAEDGALHARIEGDKAEKKGPMEWVWRKADGAASRPK
jgi:hypothetical protein